MKAGEPDAEIKMAKYSKEAKKIDQWMKILKEKGGRQNGKIPGRKKPMREGDGSSHRLRHIHSKGMDLEVF